MHHEPDRRPRRFTVFKPTFKPTPTRHTVAGARRVFARDYSGRDPAEARRVAFYGSLNEQIQRSFQTADEPASTAFKARRGAASRWRNAAGRPRVRKAVRALVAVVVACAAVSGWFAATQVTQRALNNAAVMALAETVAAPYPAASPTRREPSAPDLEEDRAAARR